MSLDRRVRNLKHTFAHAVESNRIVCWLENGLIISKMARKVGRFWVKPSGDVIIVDQFVDVGGPGTRPGIVSVCDAELDGKAKVMAVLGREGRLSSCLERPIVVGGGVVFAETVGINRRAFRRTERRRVDKKVDCCCKAALAIDLGKGKLASKVKVRLNELWAMSEETKRIRRSRTVIVEIFE